MVSLRPLARLLLAAPSAGALRLELVRPQGLKPPDGIRPDYEVGDIRVPIPIPAGPPGEEAIAKRLGADEGSADGLLVALEIEGGDVAEAVALHTRETNQPSSMLSVHLQLFTISYASPKQTVEQWLTETNAPAPHNALRFTALFETFFRSEHGGIIRDEHGDSCVGMPLRAELCLQALACVPIAADQFPLVFPVWVPTPVATNFRLEAYVSGAACQPETEAIYSGWLDAVRMRRLVEVALEEPDDKHGKLGTMLVGTQLPARAKHLSFRLKYLDEPSAWWSAASDVQGELDLADSWMEMMEAVLRLTEPWAEQEALWMEFGVASGKSTAFIASQMKRRAPRAKLHGFDSFLGIQTGWNSKLAESFSMEGKPPEHLENMDNVEIHIGYFAETLKDLDRYRQMPVAFAHIDVDLYASAREVLTYLRCQLVPGSVLVFDEFFNYQGWQRDGEYRAWQLFAAETGISWRPLGVYFEQSVAIAIEGFPQGC